MSTSPIQAHAVLFVDDEEKSCKWFARKFASEFTILTACNVEDAIALLNEHRNNIAVLITDYSMPGRTGLDLLQVVQREHRNVIRLLTSAYADKDVAIAAVNEGKVFRILEKPMDFDDMRTVLKDALMLHQAQAMERALHESRAEAMRETLGFLSHEINTPLTTVRGHMAGLIDRYQTAPDPTEPNRTVAMFTERKPGSVLAALESCERAALYCQSLVSTFVQSARDAHPGPSTQPISASGLVKALLEDFPFENDERSWVNSEIQTDFELPGQRDLLYLVLCTLTKNAIFALRGGENPTLKILLSTKQLADANAAPCIQFIDTGHGITPEVLAKLTKEPITTRADSGGNGMGLMFCKRLMLLLGGSIEISSVHGAGTTVSLCFPSLQSATPT